MNKPANPITGPGIPWAIAEINRHFERAAKLPPAPTEESPEEQTETLEELKR